jgi:hypothetical protein
MTRTTTTVDLSADEHAEVQDFAKEQAAHWDQARVFSAVRAAGLDRELQRALRREHLRREAFPSAYRLYLLAMADPAIEAKLRAEVGRTMRVLATTPLATVVAKYALTSDKSAAFHYGCAMQEAALQKVNADSMPEELGCKKRSIGGLAKGFKQRRLVEKAPAAPNPLAGWKWSDRAVRKLAKRRRLGGPVALLLEMDDGEVIVRNLTSTASKVGRHLRPDRT